MSAARFCFSAALLAFAVLCLLKIADAAPATTRAPRAIGAPPAVFAPVPTLLGSWHDGLCLLLPPGVSLFETVSDTLVFQSDGTFTQTIEKATGTLHTRGYYSVAGSRLTLSSLMGTDKPLQYDFSRTGDRLLLQPVGPGKTAAWTLQWISTGGERKDARK